MIAVAARSGRGVAATEATLEARTVPGDEARIKVQSGYPGAAGVSENEFRRHIEPLEQRIGELVTLEKEAEEGRAPFVIVVKRDLIVTETALSLVEFRRKTGFTSMDAGDIESFGPIDGVEIPYGVAYLLVDIDTGKGTLNVTPDEALETIKGEGRSPLTIEEGLALITHRPEVLKQSNCFFMLGSRCGDHRVTALWISGGRPRLGWCWAGNPHSWLGSASCRSRVGA
jgi:hypothetical protein